VITLLEAAQRIYRPSQREGLSMNALPFRQPGQFYKGNLHSHSTNSDGRKSPAEVIDIYRGAGYHFLALTDHFLERYGFPISDTRGFRTDGFTTLLGAELHAGEITLGGHWHIVAAGLPLDFEPTPLGQSGADLCQRARTAGAYVAAAHPYWYGVTLEDIESLGEIDAIETFNGTCMGENDRGDSWHVLDALLARGHRYLACANDDAHFAPDRVDFACGWTHVKATQCEPEAILAALKAGHYYSSTGPELHDVQFEGKDSITIHCSPCRAIFVSGRSARSRRLHGDNLTEATFTLDGITSPYLRVTVVDASGGRAWTNPIWR